TSVRARRWRDAGEEGGLPGVVPLATGPEVGQVPVPPRTVSPGPPLPAPVLLTRVSEPRASMPPPLPVTVQESMVAVPPHSTPTILSPETVLRRSVRFPEELMMLFPLAGNVQGALVCVVGTPQGRR